MGTPPHALGDHAVQPSLTNISSTDVELGTLSNKPSSDRHYQSSSHQFQPSRSWQHVRPWRRNLVLLGLFVGLFMSTIDTSIVSTALVTITNDLDDYLESPWVVTAYLLTYMGFAISWARLSDIYGRKTIVMIAWVFFTAFSLGCGLANTMTRLIIFRALQGVGGSGLFSLVMTMIPEIVSPEKIGMMSGLIGMTLGCSGVLGPILGGVISNYASWRWIFFINVPVGVSALVVIVMAWPRRFGFSLSSWSAFRSIDFTGIVLMLAASFLCVCALQYASQISITTDNYNNPVIIACAVVAGCCAIGLLSWEHLLDQKLNFKVVPVLPLRVFKARVLAAAIFSSFLTGFAQITPTIELPERFQLVNKTSSTMAGVDLLPLLAASAVGSFLGGALSKKRNNTSYTLMAASSLQCIGLGCLSTLGDAISIPAKQYGFQVILGLGVGLSLSATSVLTSVKAKRGDLAICQGIVTQARVFGGALGVAIVTLIFNTQCRQQLSGVLSDTQLEELSRSPDAALSFPPQDEQATREVYANAFVQEMRFLTWVALVNVVASVCTWERHPESVAEGIRSHQDTEGERTALDARKPGKS